MLTPQKTLRALRSEGLIFVVRQAGFEPATYGFVVRRSIRAELLAQLKLIEI
jgi:hypothetical protein